MEGVCVAEECPRSVFVHDKQSKHNSDKSVNPEVEESLEGGSYFLSTAQEPMPGTLVYRIDASFTVAILNNEKPKLLVYGGNYVNMRELMCENLLPFVFPYTEEVVQNIHDQLEW